MIRINLLPVQQERQRQYGKQQLLFGLLVVIIQGLFLFMTYQSKNEELESAKTQVQTLTAEVEELRRQTAEIERLNGQRETLQQTARVLEDLEANRAGPVQVLDELKLMLNPPANDLQRTAQERRNWDTNWDPRSVWLTEFTESGGLVSISGRALSNDDIAEFNTRLANSVYFSGVRLNNTRALQDTNLGRIFQFQLTATVNYGIVDDQG